MLPLYCLTLFLDIVDSIAYFDKFIFKIGVYAFKTKMNYMYSS